IDRGALDFLDPVLLRLEPGLLQRVERKTGTETLTLERKEDKGWVVQTSPATSFAADAETLGGVEAFWQNLVASRYAAYGPKADLVKYGLDKPETVVTIKARKEAGKPETVEHTLEVGKSTDADGERYARLDKGPGVVLLNGRVVKELSRGYLE